MLCCSLGDCICGWMEACIFLGYFAQQQSCRVRRAPEGRSRVRSTALSWQPCNPRRSDFIGFVCGMSLSFVYVTLCKQVPCGHGGVRDAPDHFSSSYGQQLIHHHQTYQHDNLEGKPLSSTTRRPNPQRNQSVSRHVCTRFPVARLLPAS